jgi:cold shock CspA family protein
LSELRATRKELEVKDQNSTNIDRLPFTNAESELELEILEEHKSLHIGRLVDSDERRGIITYIDRARAFGFLQSDCGEVIFFHAYDCLDKPFGQLRTGMRVSFLLANSDKGNKVKAIGVRVV